MDVVGLGENSLDLLALSPRFPRPDTKETLLRLQPLVGGQAATAMVACARLGWRARYLGGVGSDVAGRQVLETLRREGVEAHVKVGAGLTTRQAIVLVDARSGRRTILEARDPAVALRVEDVAPAHVEDARILLVDACDPAVSMAAARIARAAGIPVVLDVERPAPGLDDLLRLADVIVAAGPFPAAFTGTRTTGRALRQLGAYAGAPVVVATLGAEGSIAWVGGRELRTRGFQVKVVDTTGAGDAFRGGLIAGWLAGAPSADAAAVLTFANAVAALNCGALGAQAGLPTRQAVEAFVTRVRRGQSN